MRKITEGYIVRHRLSTSGTMGGGAAGAAEDGWEGFFTIPAELGR